MKNLIFGVLFVFIFLTSCNTENHITYFTRDDFKKSSSIVSENIKINTELIFQPIGFYLIRDSILLIENHKPSTFFIHIYNLNSQKIISSILSIGKGANENLSCYILYNHKENYFWVRDMTLWKLSRFNIDSVLEFGNSYVPTNFNDSQFAKDIYEFDKNKFICFNKLFLEDKKFSDEVDKLYFKSKISYGSIEPVEFNFNMFPANVTGGYIYTDKLQENIIVSYFYEDRIDILNKELATKKILIGPDDLSPEYIKAPFKQNLVLFADNKRWRGYYQGFYTKEFIYLIYHGIDGLRNNSGYDVTTELFKIGWNGELIHRYILDKALYNITIDSENKYCYGTHSDDGIYCELVRYTLE